MSEMVEAQPLSYDSDSDQDMPWDVKRSYSEESSGSKKKMQQQQQQQQMDPPETSPSLGLASSDDEPTRKLVSGKRSLRPLSPPSSNGLTEEQQQRDELEDDDYGEEMPMDERSEEIRRRNVCVTDDNGVFDGHFCDGTLTAMGEMCGVSPRAEQPSSKRGKAKRRAQTGTSPRGDDGQPFSLSALKAPYGAEEQTAIEVEYVEPRYRPKFDASKSDASSGTASRKKNLLVQAMAKRAKDSFDKSNGGKPQSTSRGGISPSNGEQSATTEQSRPDTVYSSFHPSEKRKFLKLINTGMTPSDATEQVLKERAEGENALDEMTDSSSKNNRRGLAFWKKKHGNEDDVPTRIVENDASEAATTATSVASKEEDDMEERFAKSGIQYYDAVRKERPEDDYDESLDTSRDAQSISSTKKKNRLSRFSLKGFNKLTNGENEESPARRRRDPPEMSSPAESATARGTVAVSSFLNEDTATPSQEVFRQLPVSSSSTQGAAELSTIPQVGSDKMAVDLDETADGSAPPAIASSLSDDSLLRDLREDDELEEASAAAQNEAVPSARAIAGFGQNMDTAVQQERQVVLDSPMADDDLVAAQLLAGANKGRNVQAPPILTASTSTSQTGSFSGDDPLTKVLSGGERSIEEEEPPEIYARSTDSFDVEEQFVDEVSNAEETIDLDVERYANEVADSYSAVNSSGDHISVVSGKSHKSYRTTNTTTSIGTNYTTSTRTRRPGAAKQRLAVQKAQKSQTGKFKGWQESIQQAAEQTGRTWDPVKGWENYVNPNSDVVEERNMSQHERMHLSLKKPEHQQPEDAASNEVASPVQVPFPEKWQQDRSAMLAEGKDISGQGPRSVQQEEISDDALANALQMTPPRVPPNLMSMENQDGARSMPMSMEATSQSQDGARSLPFVDGQLDEPTGLAENAKQAISVSKVSNAVAQGSPRDVATLSQIESTTQSQIEQDNVNFLKTSRNAHTASPTRAGRTVMQISPSRRRAGDSPRRMRSSQEGAEAKKPSGWLESMKQATSKLKPKNGLTWDPNHGWVDPNGKKTGDEQALPMAGSRDMGDISQQAESDTADFGVVTRERKDPTGQAHLGNQDKQEPKAPLLSQDDEISHDDNLGAQSVKSGRSGRYIQIGDTGSVMSFYRGGKSKKNQKEKSRALPIGSNNTTNVADASQQRSAALVNVKKEKVDSVDASLFPAERKGPGRGSGPVDLDEIDDMENGSFDAPTDFSWDEGESNVSSMAASTPPSGRKASPKLRINIRESPNRPGQMSGKSSDSRPMGERSFDSVSSTSRSIPRLRGPRRDTSPIRASKTTGRSVTSPPMPESSPMARRNGVDPTGTPRHQERGLPQALDNAPVGISPQGAILPDSYGALKSPASEASASSSVRQRAQLWEKKNQSPKDPNDVQEMTRATEWKNFLVRKAHEEHGTADNQLNQPRLEGDSVFDLPDSDGAFPTRRSKGASTSEAARSADIKKLHDMSDLSPIQHEDEDDTNMTPSEVSSSVVQPATFLERLQACAAPMVPRKQNGGANCSPMPMAHLAFLRQNPTAGGTTPEKTEASKSRFVPPTLCGRPDVIHEEDTEDEETVETREKEEKMRSRSTPRSKRQSSGDVSSVISDEQFGQKTAYIEAIAMKAAVAGKKKSKRRSPGSEISTSSSRHSEKWQKFLDKKSAKLESAQSDRSSGESVSKAAEKYAAEKVDEMMDLMAQRKRASPRDHNRVEDATGAFPSGKISSAKSDTMSRAAEDLAAARVEAMMQTLATRNADEGEI